MSGDFELRAPQIPLKTMNHETHSGKFNRGRASTIFRLQSMWFEVLILSFTFLVLPVSFSILGFGSTKPLVLVIFVAALLADAFTTRTGLKHGLGELSPMFRALKRRMSADQFIVASTIVGTCLGVLVAAEFPLVVLLAITMLLMVSVVGNSFLLSVKVFRKQELRDHQED